MVSNCNPEQTENQQIIVSFYDTEIFKSSKSFHHADVSRVFLSYF